MSQTRRSFLGVVTGAATAALMPLTVDTAVARAAKGLSISCNSYTWLTFYRRAGKEWMGNPDESMTEYAASGLQNYEPGVTDVEEIQALGPLLRQYAIGIPSMYANSTLHQPDTAPQSIELVMKIALAAKALGTRIIVTNPSPIRWDSPEDKDDAALTVQAANLEKLGSLLKAQGMTLAYHNHDIELRQGAREFHHMMTSTDPRYVSLCLDAHWVYRGMGNSQVALMDVVRLYGKRIAELHLRQSTGHIWSEVFGKGDIDYQRLVTELVRLKVRPHLVMEQCVEEKTTNTIDVVAAHQQGLKYVKEVFAPLAV
ncbi:MAG TPA: sugar phosphate isomerase/epimerase [Chryseolinea sp.]|nr:sugar phosphate isomerase/epimerase [Chryseolinea sp.]